MPTDKESTTRFDSIANIVYESGEPYAATVGELPDDRAKRIADALNDSIEHPWVGDGPDVEEAGGTWILVRFDEILEPAFWHSFSSASPWLKQGWYDNDECRIFGEMASGWRRMPKPSALSPMPDHRLPRRPDGIPW